jgi:hypothetical protein
MQDLMILHTNNIYLQSNRDDFKAYKQLHSIDMQIHSIPKSPEQKAQVLIPQVRPAHKSSPSGDSAVGR